MTNRLRGEIIFNHYLGQQGGYGVIRGRDDNEYIFTLSDIENYSGGDLKKSGICVGAVVEFQFSGSRAMEVSILYFKKPR